MNWLSCTYLFSFIFANSWNYIWAKDIHGIDIGLDYIMQLKEDREKYAMNIEERLPQLREFIKGTLPEHYALRYNLFTAGNPDYSFELNRNSTKQDLESSPYNCKDPVLFVIHGFSPIVVDLSSHPIGRLKNALFDKGEKYNVFYLDYTSTCNGPTSVGSENSFLVGKEVAKFLKHLVKETCTTLEQIHLIGYSLGGQIIGSIGRNLPGIARVTALDPSQSIFEVYPKDLVLNRDDAVFVDVIHTNIISPFPRGLGYPDSIGHLDFYPNGGQFQPDCYSTIPMESEPSNMKEIFGRECMHAHSITYYMESITNNNCTFIGTLCESNDDFESGLCSPANSTTAVMGHYATKPKEDLPENEKFFLNTNKKPPFCKSNQP